jgi:hypothetical protein
MTLAVCWTSCSPLLDLTEPGLELTEDVTTAVRASATVSSALGFARRAR